MRYETKWFSMDKKEYLIKLDPLYIAAPDLVEALKEAKNYIGLFIRAQGHDPKNEPTYQRIEAALLKATEQQ